MVLNKLINPVWFVLDLLSFRNVALELKIHLPL